MKPYAWEINVELSGGSVVRSVRVAPTARQASRRALQRKHAVKVVSLEPMTEEEYRGAYGYHERKVNG